MRRDCKEKEELIQRVLESSARALLPDIERSLGAAHNDTRDAALELATILSRLGRVAEANQLRKPVREEDPFRVLSCFTDDSQHTSPQDMSQSWTCFDEKNMANELAR